MHFYLSTKAIFDRFILILYPGHLKVSSWSFSQSILVISFRSRPKFRSHFNQMQPRSCNVQVQSRSCNPGHLL